MPQPRYAQLSFGQGTVYSAAFSPDGGSVLYSAAWDGNPERIFSLRLDLPLEQPLGLEGRLVGTAGGELAFLRHDRTLLLAPLSGGGTREVANEVLTADWSAAGAQFAITRRVGAKQVLEYPIGTVLHETAGEFLRPRVSPDGKRVAVVERESLGVMWRLGRRRRPEGYETPHGGQAREPYEPRLVERRARSVVYHARCE